MSGMKHKPLKSSYDWIAYFYENAQKTASVNKPKVEGCLPQEIRKVFAGSLPAWQLGETSDGRHLRLAARQYAEAQDDPGFLISVDFFIREEQRHGSALGEWLDLVGIPRKSRDWGDSIFRGCRYAIPNYAIWASVVVMVESMAEIYYSAVRRLSPCPRLKAECERILRDEVRHIRFQCEHLAASRKRVPRWLRNGMLLGEMVFYGAVCLAVWTAHGRLLRLSGLRWTGFVKQASHKFCVMRRLMAPERYEFPQTWKGTALLPIRVRV